MTNKQHAFVTEYLRQGDKITAYCLAYNIRSNNFTSIESAANRLLRNPEIAKAVNSVRNAIRHEVEQEIKMKLRQELLTIQRKREILAKIATGEMYVAQAYKGKDCTQCTQLISPNINQVLKAIDLDNKMTGVYAAQQKKTEPVHPVAGFTPSEACHKEVDEFIEQFELPGNDVVVHENGNISQQHTPTPITNTAQTSATKVQLHNKHNIPQQTGGGTPAVHQALPFSIATAIQLGEAENIS